LGDAGLVPLGGLDIRVLSIRTVQALIHMYRYAQSIDFPS
jgi:hypothetical protein